MMRPLGTFHLSVALMLGFIDLLKKSALFCFSRVNTVDVGSALGMEVFTLQQLQLLLTRIEGAISSSKSKESPQYPYRVLPLSVLLYV